MNPEGDRTISKSKSEPETTLSGRPTLSLETFRSVAQEVANQLKIPVAICERSTEAAGNVAIPFVNRPLEAATKDGNKIIEVVQPANLPEGQPPTTIDIVKDALSKIPHGEKVDRYFGITSGKPEQSPEEALRAEKLLERLRKLGEGSVSDEKFLEDLSAHSKASKVDPESLRALMRPSKLKKPEK